MRVCDMAKEYIVMSIQTASLLLLLVTGHPSAMLADEICVFPDFMENDVTNPNDYWLIHSTTSGELKTAMFAGSYITLQEAHIANSPDTRTYNATCVKELPDISPEEFAYVINVTAEGSGDLKYVCFAALQRTANVYRYEIGSVAENATEAEDNCPQKVVEWWTKSHKVAVSNIRRDNTWTFCPIEGGWAFQATSITVLANGTETNYKEWCPNYPESPLVESECTKGDGLVFTFPYTQCIPIPGWTSNQNVYCRDAWLEHATHYIIAHDIANEQFYCMKFNQSDPDVHTLQLFQDLMCPTLSVPANTTYINMALVNTTFSDDLRRPQCEFDSSLVENKDWLLVDSTNQYNVTFNDSSLRLPDLDLLHCHSRVYPQSLTYTVMPEVKHGCRPRFSCVQFSLVPDTRAVLMYKLGHSVVVSEGDSKYDVCDPGMFYNDPEPLGDKYRSRFNKNLIARGFDPGTVACGIHGNYTFRSSMQTSALKLCQGQVGDRSTYCYTTTMLYAKFDAVCDMDKFKPEHMCLASFHATPGGPLLVLTKGKLVSLDSKSVYNCWMFHQDSSDSSVNVMHLLNGAQCNTGTDDDIQAGRLRSRLNGTTTRVDMCGESTTATSASSKQTSITSPHTSVTWATGSSTGSTTGGTTGTSHEMSSDTQYQSNSTVPSTSEAQGTSNPTPTAGMSSGAVAGIVIGSILLAFVLAGFTYLAYRSYTIKRIPYRVL